MEIEFDPGKSELNAIRRGLPFEMVEEFDFETALIAEDNRRDYGESRFLAVGIIRGRPFVLAFTWRSGRVRVISFRKANARETYRYEQAKPRGD